MDFPKKFLFSFCIWSQYFLFGLHQTSQEPFRDYATQSLKTKLISVEHLKSLRGYKGTYPHTYILFHIHIYLHMIHIRGSYIIYKQELTIGTLWLVERINKDKIILIIYWRRMIVEYTVQRKIERAINKDIVQ